MLCGNLEGGTGGRVGGRFKKVSEDQSVVSDSL